MSKPVWAVLAVAFATALVAAGCGGGSESSESTASLTKSELLKKGNAICAEGGKEISRGFEEFAKEHHFSKSKPPSEAEVVEAVQTVLIPRIRKQLNEIRALGPPQGAEAEFEAIIASVESALKKGEENPKLLAGEGEGPFEKANKLSREFGLTKCGEEEG